jgi:hypothetical protein
VTRAFVSDSSSVTSVVISTTYPERSYQLRTRSFAEAMAASTNSSPGLSAAAFRSAAVDWR